MKKSQKIRGKQNRRKVAGACALAIGLFFISHMNVYASQPDYTQEITPEMELEGTTGIMQDNEETQGTTNRVSVGSGIVYDANLGLYAYSVGEAYLYANVLDGMLTQSAVAITADEGVEYTIYRESEPYTPDAEEITEVGNYTIMTGATGAETKVLSFTIIGSDINAPASYELPVGCILIDATLDGEEVTVDNRSISLTEDGHYTLSYRCVRNNLQYTLDFTVDHTAPTLTLEGVKNGKARNAVTLKDIEEGSTITILKDGNEISSRTTIQQPGAYTVRVTDKAGNSSAYSFYILFYLNAGSISFGVILLVAFAALGTYLYVSRRRLRIR